MYLTTDSAGLYPAPDSDETPVSYLPPQQQIQLTETTIEREGWVWRKVEFWVRERSSDGAQVIFKPYEAPRLFVKAVDNGIKLRAQPVTGEATGSILQGEVLEVLEDAQQAAAKIGVDGQWIHVRRYTGAEGYTAAWFYTITEADAPTAAPPPPEPVEEEPAPVSPPSVRKTYAKARDRIRLRAEPVFGETLGLVLRGEIVELIDPPEEIERKLGVEGEWLQVRTLPGTEGYTAAWFYDLYEGPLPSVLDLPPDLAGTNIVGMNLDIFHPLGLPHPSRLGEVGWVRFLYNVSLNPDRHGVHDGRYGNTDLEATYNRYKPALERYARAGKKVLLVFTHQTYGEGQGYDLGNLGMETAQQISDRLAGMLGRIAAQFKGQNIVHAFQIWNEQDAHKGARASIPLEPEQFAYMLTRCIQTVKTADSSLKVITGGHASGPGTGAPYIRRTIAAMPGGIRPDGIAFHPYGRGAPESDPKYRHFGNIDEEILAYSSVLPGKPMWITEWGVLDAPGEPAPEISRYAREFINRLKTLHAGKIATAMWYAWGQGMDNGYGLVDEQDRPKERFWEEYIKL